MFSGVRGMMLRGSAECNVAGADIVRPTVGQLRGSW